MKRRIAFTLFLFLAIAIDMFSTYLAVVKHGFGEQSQWINYLIGLHPALLLLWPFVFPSIVILFYAALEKQNLHMHLEVMVLLFTINTVGAIINNFYLIVRAS